jgi:hypothetical protein
MHECANAGGPRAKEPTSSKPLAHEEVSRKNRVRRAKQEHIEVEQGWFETRLGRIFYYAAIRCDPPGYPVTRWLGTIRLMTLSTWFKKAAICSFLSARPTVRPP